MIKSSKSLYRTKRSDLEILFDVGYVLAKESRPLSMGYLSNKRRIGAHTDKLKEILDKCEKKDLVKQCEKVGVIQRYELTQRGKELIYTWLDYTDKFNLKDLLKSKYHKPLPEKENSRLKEIMKKSWKPPHYAKSNCSDKRSQIMLYRDFLSYIKSYYPGQTYQWSIIAENGININSKYFEKLRENALERKHIRRKHTLGYIRRKWKHRVAKKGRVEVDGFEVFQPKYFNINVKRRNNKQLINWRSNIDELISLTKTGYRCVNTFDKIMMEYGLTDLVYTYKK